MINKHKLFFFCRFIAILLVITTLVGCSAGTYPHTAFIGDATDSAENWNIASDDVVKLSNGSLELVMDVSNTHFTITNTVSGQSYTSVPQTTGDTYSNETSQRIKSELSITYFDQDSTEYVMTSNGDSVEKDLYEVRYTDNSIRVYYTMGATAKLLVPQVLPVEVFEQEICNEDILSKSIIRRINRYYDLYSPDDEQNEELSEMMEKYPALKKQALYILKDTVDTLKEIEISDACATVGFTDERNTQIMDELGVEAVQSDEPGFKIVVEYCLNSDGFTAEVLTDEIEIMSQNYQLYSVDLLEYFACANSEQSGYFLVPDGSGALIDFNGREGNYSQTVYGNDLSIQGDSKTQLAKEALLPLYGISFGDGAVLAIAESGEANAIVHANTISASNPQNNAYFTFNLCALDVTDLGEERSIPVYNLYGKHIQYEHPRVRYVLLSSEKADYVGMADYVRNYYINNGSIPQKAKLQSNFFVDYSCVITQDTTVLGVPYKKRTVLSTIEDIKSQLDASSINGLSVRLLGYTKNGLTHELLNKFSLYNKVGSKSELVELASSINKNGGQLYLDADFSTVLTDTIFDGFAVRRDTAKYINRSLVIRDDYDIITRKYYDGINSQNLVSPTLYADAAASYIKSVEKVLGADASIGLSYASAGSLLYGDYDKNKDYDRSMASSVIKDVLSASDEKYPVLTENGYLYSLSTADYLLNAPLYSSNFDIETAEVPFYQLVIHGNVPYTGVSMNMTTDGDNLLLRSLEYGAGLYWSLITEDDHILNDTDYEVWMYSMNSKNNFAEITQLYSQLSDYYNAISDSQMISHKKLADGVYMTQYASGAGVIVNYSDTEYIYENYSVDARGYKTWLS